MNDLEEPDPRPGNYYVSVIEGKRYALLYGPFTRHQDALDAVERVRAKAYELDRYSHWYAFGTARAPDDYNKPGKLNDYLPPIETETNDG